MRIKVDEDLPGEIADLLRARDHEATSVLEQEMGGVSDRVLWDAVQSEGRFLVTADKGFADLRLHPPGSHCGLLLLRPDEDGIRPLVELLVQVLEAVDLEELAGSVAVANPRRLRIRR
jgi:predicted nuclease of predicted toxin-antitoxin system